MEKDEENLKKETISRKKKIRLISIFVILVLIVFIVCDYVFIIRKSKVVAPESTTQSQKINNQEADSSLPDDLL